MEHALFLEKPIRGNPRQHAQARECLSSITKLPSTPSDSASPPSSQHGHSPAPALESDDLLTSATEQSAGTHMSTISCMTQPQWQSPERDILATPSPSDQADPEEASRKPTSSQHARRDSKGGTRKTTKAACSACRKRKSKVRQPRIATHFIAFVSLRPLYIPFCSKHFLPHTLPSRLTCRS